MTKTLDKHISKRLIINILAALALVSVLTCTLVGSVSFTPNEIFSAVLSKEQTPAKLIVLNMRLPRVLSCALVGICLSLSGCILKGIMRNDLASPSTVGVTAGAGFVGYITLVVFPEYSSLLPIGTVVGSFAVTMLIYILAFKNGVSPVRMILSGMAVSAFFGALCDSIKTLFASSVGNASGFLVGGFNGCSWNSLNSILPYAILGIAVCILMPRQLNVLMLGDEVASSLGLPVEPVRFALIAVSSLLAGAAVATAGLISFVGLIVPHIARLLVGSDHKYLLPASALLGCTLVTVCDTVGRLILPPGEIPVGIILSLIGAPFFLWLIRARSTGGNR